MSELYEALTGQPQARHEPRPRAEHVVTTFFCTCAPGALLGVLDRRYGRSTIWKRGYRHTRRGTAGILLDAAIDDAETLRRREELVSLSAVLSFCRVDGVELSKVVPPLAMPATAREITNIGAQFAALAATRPGLETLPGGFLTECGDCRRLRELARAVLEIEPLASPPDRVAVGEDATEPEAVAYEWPTAALDRRVLLYRRLSVVLA